VKVRYFALFQAVFQCIIPALSQKDSTMKWTDTQRIAEELFDTHSDIDPKTIRFIQLRELVLALPDFNDDPNRSGERVLEAIQQAWINEIE
jgi:feS assembly protein iscX